MSMTSLGISAGFMVGCCIAAQIARRVSRRVLSEGGIVPVLMNEAIAAAELCACCFELIIGKLHFKLSQVLEYYTYNIILDSGR